MFEDEDHGAELPVLMDQPYDALGYLQSIYRDPAQPEGRRMRAAMAALPFESPKLSATAILRDGDSFAAALDRAIMRSGKLIEAKAIETPQPE
jgi:hypothetical protein